MNGVLCTRQWTEQGHRVPLTIQTSLNSSPKLLVVVVCVVGPGTADQQPSLDFGVCAAVATDTVLV